MHYDDMLDIRHGHGKASNLGRAGAFVQVCTEIFKHGADAPWHRLADYHEGNPGREAFAQFAKAAVSGASTFGWPSGIGRDISAAYLAQVAPANLADAIKPHAKLIPEGLGRVLIGTGVIAEGVAEGAARPVSAVSLSGETPDRAKVGALIVFSNELRNTVGDAGEQVFRNLLKNAVIEASNSAVLSAIGSLTPVSSGYTAVESLAAGLAAADYSNHYVVAARPDICRELALASDGRMAVGGGEFIPGVTIVPVDLGDSPARQMIVFAADSVAMHDSGLIVRQTSEADIEMDSHPSGDSSTPTAGATVSLFQVGASALIVERDISILAAHGVEVI